MTTPSIQTLITQAQQVLNLKSTNEIRATLAAVLANANVGTPLNPNLTTQQLWDEFYEIVRQPSDDIMSIVVDQMMRMVFSPPAPGGAGADKQVIFNDMGVLAGDPGLVYNKTTDALTVVGLVTAGSATITGDLTVRTDKLKVTSTGVGFGTTTPTGVADFLSAVIGNSNVLTIGNNEYGAATYLNSNSVSLTFNRGTSFKTGAVVSSNVTSGNLSEGYIAFQTSTSNVLTERYRIDNVGNSIWSVAGTTAMTLNSTGLGVGVTPAAGDGSGIFKAAGTGALTASTRVGLDVRELTSGNQAGLIFGAMTTENTGVIGSRTASGNIAFQTFNGASWGERMRIDYLGNVGVGVTPSAWGSSYKAVQLTGGVLTSYVNGTIAVIQNSYDTTAGTFRYVVAASSPASFYQQFNGAHEWSNASAGTAGNLINGTGAWTSRMTLDASGNLLVGTTAVGMTAGGVRLKNGGGNLGEITLSNNSGAADYVARFVWGSGATLVGNITVSSVATVYNTISDYRLKEAVKPLNGGLARVNALKPSVYNWKSDGSTGEGFLAHELAEVVPAAVTGEKDALNADGSIKSQGIDMSRVVPILVAAIQELTARVQTLESR